MPPLPVDDDARSRFSCCSRRGAGSGPAERYDTMETAGDKWRIAFERTSRPVWTIGWRPATTEVAYKRQSISRKHRTISPLSSAVGSVPQLRGRRWRSAYNNFALRSVVSRAVNTHAHTHTSSSGFVWSIDVIRTHRFFAYLREIRDALLRFGFSRRVAHKTGQKSSESRLALPPPLIYVTQAANLPWATSARTLLSRHIKSLRSRMQKRSQTTKYIHMVAQKISHAELSLMVSKNLKTVDEAGLLHPIWV